MRWALVCITALLLMGPACGRAAEGPAPALLATVPGGVPLGTPPGDVEVLTLLACADNGNLVEGYTTPQGVVIREVHEEQELWRHELAFGTSSGALCRMGGRTAVALVGFDHGGLLIASRRNGAWDEQSIPAPVAGGSLLWPAFWQTSDGALEVLCFVQTPGGLNADAGLYSVPVGDTAPHWTFVRRGTRPWTSSAPGAPTGAFVYLTGSRSWAVAHAADRPADDVLGPAPAGGVYDALLGVDGADYVLWQRAASKPFGLVLSRIAPGGTETLEVPGITDYQSARLVSFGASEVAVVGLSDSGVVYARRVPLDAAHLTSALVCRRSDMMGNAGRAVAVTGLRAVWWDSCLHLLYCAVYADHADYLHKVIVLPRNGKVE
jgi:hypothetical protein